MINITVILVSVVGSSKLVVVLWRLYCTVPMLVKFHCEHSHSNESRNTYVYMALGVICLVLGIVNRVLISSDWVCVLSCNSGTYMPVSWVGKQSGVDEIP